MFTIVTFATEVVIATVSASVLFLFETTTNLAPHKNARRAVERVKKDIKYYKM